MSLLSRRSQRGSSRVAKRPPVQPVGRTRERNLRGTTRGLRPQVRNPLSAGPAVTGRTGALQPRTLQTPRTLASLSGGLQGPGDFAFSGVPTSPISTGANQRLGITLPNGQVIRVGTNEVFTPGQGLGQAGIGGGQLQRPRFGLQEILTILQGGSLDIDTQGGAGAVRG